MSSVTQTLEEIGFTEGESKAYVAMLELGPSSVGPLTKRTGVSYSNIYEILQRLLDKGAASVIIKNNVKHFQAAHPTELHAYLSKKEQELIEHRKRLDTAMPQITALLETHPRQEAKMFIGIRGLRAAYEEFFSNPEKGDENLWIYVHDERYAKASDKFYGHEWFELAKGVESRGIADPSYQKSDFLKKYQEKYRVRFVDFPIFSHGEIFKDRFLLVSWEEPVIAVLIYAKHVSDHFKKYFESIWKVAKS